MIAFKYVIVSLMAPGRVRQQKQTTTDLADILERCQYDQTRTPVRKVRFVFNVLYFRYLMLE